MCVMCRISARNSNPNSNQRAPFRIHRSSIAIVRTDSRPDERNGRVLLKLENDVNSVDNTRNVTQNRQQDVDEEIGIAAAFEEHAERREEDGEDELDDVASGEGHCCRCLCVVCVFCKTGMWVRVGLIVVRRMRWYGRSEERRVGKECRN